MKWLVGIAALLVLASCQSCISDGGQTVDWFIVLKAPSQNGGYGYYDSQMNQQNVKNVKLVSNKSFIDPSTGVYKTLKQVNDNNLSRVAWNDGETSSSTYAHSKVLIAFSTATKKAFEIVHSLPKFPTFTNNKIVLVNAKNSDVYGQHLFCMSLSLDTLSSIAQKAVNIRGYVFESWLNSKDSGVSASIKGLLEPENPNKKPPIESPFSYLDFRVGSTPIKSIYKRNAPPSSIFGDSEDEKGITAMLSSNLLVETWRGDKGSFCPAPGSNSFKVEYVKSISLGAGFTMNWRRTQDHSKWAITTSPNIYYSCFGGQNRQTSQWSRGGQFFCLNSANLHGAMKAIITDQEKC